MIIRDPNRPHLVTQEGLRALINGNSWFSINRHIARSIGLNAAVFLSELIDKYEFFSSSGKLTEDGWFYLTIEDAEERTTLAKDAQRGSIKVLQSLGILQCKQMGMPSKRYFKINDIALGEWIQNIFADRGNSDIKKAGTRKQDSENSDIKKSEKSQPAPIDIKRTKRKELYSPPPPSSKPKPPKPKTQPPTEEEEKEIERRYRERPKDADPVVSKKRWAKEVLEDIRSQKAYSETNAENFDKHKSQAQSYDMQKINGATVYACNEYVEFTNGSYCKQVKYNVPDDEWKKLTGWS